MAEGDKIFIADKTTLDEVNSKVGQTGNTGGSASAGTLFGKLNAIISSIESHVANWTAARAAKVDNLDATVSSRQSEANALSRYNQLNTNSAVNNTASATGTLSQKLSHIINLFASNTAKNKSTKLQTVSVPRNTTATVLNLSGAGELICFYYAPDSSSAPMATCTIVKDGQTFSQQLTNYGVHGLGFNIASGQLLTGFNTENAYRLIAPISFSKSISIQITIPDGYAGNCAFAYNLSE